MAITISGENNNDRILAQDGVIDQISGINIVGLITASHINVGSNIQLGNAGIITATTFVGNVTGNVNSTSPLLLQTGGSERFRITGNNELGIAGANYGSSGQVLTSGGSGSAVTWSAIPSQVSISNNADNRVITGGSGTNLNGEANLTFDGTTILKQQFTATNTYAANDTTQCGYQAHNLSDTTNTYAAIRLTAGSSSPATAQIASIRTGTGQNDLTFQLETGNTAFEALRINSSGYVGVKRSTPLANLHTTNNELAIGANPTGAAAPNATYDGLVVDGEEASLINIRSCATGTLSYGRVAFSDDVRSRGSVSYTHLTLPTNREV